ncbi:MAG: MarR family transcriptional regulator [Alphaproteobacteria bacterium]|nr:MarR family transcriptional regulator [Alphaproteobacteria bacterium]MBU2379594.1 MarR family transcriptional regulator [Alphaproteobacteria bacterium]
MADISPLTPVEPADTLIRSVRRIAQAIDVRSRAVSRLTGLTLPQLLVLQSIRSMGEVTTQAISRDVFMSAPTVVVMLDKLETRGMVVRYRSSIDRRVVHARLTEAGAAALQQSPGLLGDAFLDRFARLPARRRVDIADAVAELAALMTADAAGPEPAKT